MNKEQVEKAYYEGKPVMSDKEYDEKFPNGSPVGVKTLKGVVPHIMPMMSIKKKKVPLENVYDKLVKEVTAGKVITPKIDGAAVELIYNLGVLQNAVTRGDGRFGSSVSKIETLSIPHSVHRKETIVVYGEIYYVTSSAEQQAKQQELTAGKLSSDENKHKLRFLAYGSNRKFDTYLELLAYLKGLGFDTVPAVDVDTAIEILQSNTLEQFTPHHFVECDGIVIKNNYYTHEHTERHWKDAYAIKHYRDIVVKTIVNSIQWQISRKNKLIPVANIKEVIIGKKTIKKVSAYNYAFAKDIKMSQPVTIALAGGIVPQMTLSPTKSTNNFKVPAKCPYCGAKTYVDGVNLMCSNDTCRGVELERLKFLLKHLKVKKLPLASITELIAALDAGELKLEFSIDQLFIG